MLAKQIFKLRTLLALALGLSLASAGVAEPTPLTIGGDAVTTSLENQTADAWFRFEAASAGVHWVSVMSNTVNQKLVVDVYQGEGAARQGMAQYIHSKHKGNFLFGVALQPGVHYLRFWTQYSSQGSIRVGVSKANDGTTVPAIKSFSINNGATTATQTAVTLNSVASGASVSFLAVDKAWLTLADWPTIIMRKRWEAYSAAAPYMLSPTNGTKNVTLTVKTAEGVLSKPATYNIDLLRILPLTVNDIYFRYYGEDAPGPDEYYWFRFAAQVESNYAICAKHPDSKFFASLYGPNNRGRLIAEQTVDYGKALVRRLTPGVYYIKARSAETGSGADRFLIKVAAAPGPFLNRVSITNSFGPDELGRAMWVDRRLKIASEAVGGPKEYQASLSPSFRGAHWQRYAKEVTYDVAPPRTKGTLYFRVRDAQGRVSLTEALGFNIEDVKPLTLGKGVSMDWALGNKTELRTFKVTGAGDYMIDLNMESPTGPNWPYWSATLQIYDSNRPGRLVSSETFMNPPVTDPNKAPRAMRGRMGARLTPGTYYLRLWQSEFSKVGLKVSHFSGAPMLKDFHINNGTTGEYTMMREVTLHNDALGDPKEIIVSSNNTFAGARWRPYAKTIRFRLPKGNGAATVYAKVRNKAGASKVYSDLIHLREPSPLSANGNWHGALVNYLIPDFYTLTVAAAGKYSVETDGPDGITIKIKVYDSGMKQLTPSEVKVPGDDQLRHTFDLAPGVYMIETPGQPGYVSNPDENVWASTYYAIRAFSGE